MQKEKKSTRSILHTLLSLAVLLAVLAGGVGLLAVKGALNSYIDETPEGLYTLSEDFLRTTESITDEITITFCADPDALLANQLTRYVYIMAKEIERRMPNVQVVTCDVENDPTAVQQFRTTSASVIKWNHVIVSTGGERPRYRLYTASRFWNYDQTGQTLYAFDGEYRMATAFLSLTAQNTPVAYFTVGHGEKVYDPDAPESADSLSVAAFCELLQDAGLRVATLNLDTDPIPADCALLILNGPTADYPTEEYLHLEKTGPVEKIDRYLDGIGSLMVFKDPAVSLPVLEEYLTEWGIAYGSGEYIRAGAQDGGAFPASYPTEKDMSYALFSDVLSLSTPPRVSFRNAGTLASAWEDGTRYLSTGASVFTAPLFRSPDTATVRNEAGEVLARGARPVAMITRLTYREDARDYYSYVLAAASTSLTESETLGNTAYANYDILFSLVRTMSARNAYADDTLGGLNINTEKYGGKTLVSDAIKAEDTTRYDKEQKKDVVVYHGLTEGMKIFYTVLLCLIPLAVAVAGVVVHLRRKNR